MASRQMVDNESRKDEYNEATAVYTIVNKKTTTRSAVGTSCSNLEESVRIQQQPSSDKGTLDIFSVMNEMFICDNF